MHINDATELEPVIAGMFAISTGRLAAALAALLGLTGIVIGGAALTRRTGRFRSLAGRDGRPARTVAMALGLTSLALGGLVVATSDGGLGTGNGRGGGIVAMVLGVTALTLGALGRARTREVV